MLFLVDMSMLIHQMFHRVNAKDVPEGEKPYDTVDWVLNRLEKFRGQFGMNDAFQGCRYVACFDSSSRVTFRHSLWPEYKADRTSHEGLREAEESVIEAVARDEDWFSVVAPDGFETDDVIASMVTQEEGKVVVVTKDKDYHQLLEKGRVTILKDSKTPVYNRPMRLEWFTYHDCIAKYEVSPRLWPLYQAIIGGKDNIPGWDGVGPKKAVHVLIEAVSFDRLDVHREVFGLNSRQRDSWPLFRHRLPFLLATRTLRRDLVWPDNVPMCTEI